MVWSLREYCDVSLRHNVGEIVVRHPSSWERALKKGLTWTQVYPAVAKSRLSQELLETIEISFYMDEEDKKEFNQLWEDLFRREFKGADIGEDNNKSYSKLYKDFVLKKEEKIRKTQEKIQKTKLQRQNSTSSIMMIENSDSAKKLPCSSSRRLSGGSSKTNKPISKSAKILSLVKKKSKERKKMKPFSRD